MGQQRRGSGIAFFEIAVAEIGMDGAVANWVYWLPLAPAAAFRERVMPFGHVTHRPVAEPAVQHRCSDRLLLIFQTA